MKSSLRKRAVALTGAVAIALAGLPNLVAHGSPADPVIQVEVAKTKRYVHVFGDAPSGTRKVRVQLWKQTPDGAWKKLAATGGRVVGTSFKARVDRPKRGTCLARASTKNRRGKVLGRGEEQFPCSIPPFGTGTASLNPSGGSPGPPSRQIDVWVADDETERGHGLMYRKWMPEDRGMVFLFEEPGQGGFFMLNTLIPLSIAFFDGDGVIVDILDMEPCPDSPCPTYTPDAPYSGALEVNQGAFGTWGISEGDTITVNQP